MDLIQKSRLRKLPRNFQLSGVSHSRLVVPCESLNREISKESGVLRLSEIGDRILPGIVGPATKRNLTGRVIVHRNRPKEPRTWQILWGREQFCGGGETEWVEDYVTKSQMCYPRTELPAENIEIGLVANAEGKRLFASELLDHKDEERWVTAANMFLEIFGYVWVLQPEEINVPLVATRQLNWEFLPPGKREWKHILEKMQEAIEGLRHPTQRRTATRNLQNIHSFGPDQVVIGHGGFHRYVAFCFTGRGFTVLESIEPNNATYILGADWEHLSQLSKVEILARNHQLARVVHSNHWQQEIERWFRRHAA